ncbi:L,D-transpeptidase family protein [Halonatronum saccharophilum]|uniref:L,D-transpeptidase family protein n=1 Tax=Halonatronum saccharophilum TaxID=150060 RepID=UPI000480C817|nr:peptidoglycan-binding protein [Halonatronum saccharophilum]
MLRKNFAWVFFVIVTLSLLGRAEASLGFGKENLYITQPYLKGEKVFFLQEILKILDYYEGDVDGIYGPTTAQAVGEYQKSRGMDKDFKVDKKLWDDLLTEMKVSGEKLDKPEGKVLIIIDIPSRLLKVYSDKKLYKEFRVAVGKKSTPSPVGDWKINQKAKWGGGFGTRWMKLNVPWGKYGIHGTNKPNSIGWAASHGCIRMLNRDVEALYDWVNVGTRVHIRSGEFHPLRLPLKELNLGSRGSNVMVVQKRLKQLGYFNYNPDGIYRIGTKAAVKKFQQDNGLQDIGIVDDKTYRRLNLILFE